MAFDLILRAARIAGREDRLVDIGIRDGRIAAIEPALAGRRAEERIEGRLVAPGFVETHIHLDKSCIIDRCTIGEGTLQEAIAETARAKRAFTEEDIVCPRPPHAGAGDPQRHHAHAHPRRGRSRASACKGFEAIAELTRDYAWALDLQICVFPQEGLINDPGTEELLVAACARGRRPDRRLPLHRHAPARADRAHLRDRPALRPRHRLPSRLRPRSRLDAPRRGVPRRPTPTATAAASPSAMPPSSRPCRPSGRWRSRDAWPTPAWPSPCCRRPICS